MTEDPSYVTFTRLVLGIVITIENITLLVVILKCRLFSNKYLFTASLGVTDLLVGIGLLSTWLLALKSVESKLGSGSEVGQAIVIALITALFILSIVQMAVIAIERYLYIAHPFFYRKHLTPKTIRRTILFAWTFGITFMVIYGPVLVCGYGYCHVDQRTITIMKVSLGMVFVGVFFIVVAITCVCYVKILLEVRRHRRIIISFGAVRTVPKWRDNIKSIKFFLTVFGVCFIMTAPISVIQCWNQFFPKNEVVTHIVSLVLSANSGVNFVIMICIDNNFRHSLRTVIAAPKCTTEFSFQ